MRTDYHDISYFFANKKHLNTVLHCKITPSLLCQCAVDCVPVYCQGALILLVQQFWD